ncbi:MAG: phosphopentomutase [Clostridia bacterium]|nr:phosphopentomutase [Clostridia bacterium]
MARAVIIVLDSLGIGALPDAARFGDEGSNTLKSISASPNFRIPHLLRAGLGHIDGVDYLEKSPSPTAAFCRMAEQSAGKDTTVGHWELAGLVSSKPLPTYPEGFPPEIIEEFEKRTGRRVLCNQPYSGTDVIRDFGPRHEKTGELIVYTSADSVFQIAACESVVPVETLYEYCRTARELLCGEHAVGRVIARPYVLENGERRRTANRHDFSLAPAGETLLDAAKAQGLSSVGVGKIGDIFAHRGLTAHHPIRSNAHGLEVTAALLEEEFDGLLFVNLVEFDSVYGHRNDVDGYAAALSEFDTALPALLSRLRKGDVLFVTADHGCDPATPSTDHSREYVPLLAFGEGLGGQSFGTRQGFRDLAETVSYHLGLEKSFGGTPFWRS